MPTTNTQWVKKQLVPIKWSYAGPIGEFVRIDLLKRGSLYREILSRVSLEYREIEWKVPDELPPGKDYQVRLIARETGLEAKSDFFEIV
jgi:hypothetical protein